MKISNLILIVSMIVISSSGWARSQKPPGQIDPSDTEANLGTPPVRVNEKVSSESKSPETSSSASEVSASDELVPTTPSSSSSGSSSGSIRSVEIPPSTVSGSKTYPRSGSQPEAKPAAAAADSKKGDKWVPGSRDVLTMANCGNQKLCIGLSKRGGYAKLGDEIFCEPVNGKCPSVEECAKAKTNMQVHRPNNFAKIRAQKSSPAPAKSTTK